MSRPAFQPIAHSPLGFAKPPAPWARFVTPFFLSVVMTCVISGASSLRGVGFTAGFLPLWLGSWSLSWVFAYPTLLLVLPLARRKGCVCTRRIVADQRRAQEKEKRRLSPMGICQAMLAIASPSTAKPDGSASLPVKESALGPRCAPPLQPKRSLTGAAE